MSLECTQDDGQFILIMPQLLISPALAVRAANLVPWYQAMLTAWIKPWPDWHRAVTHLLRVLHFSTRQEKTLEKGEKLDGLGDMGDLSACDLHASLTNERLWQVCWRYGSSALLESR
ncbi:hypothetical protein D4764_05G0008560 [Takifugu flavidus]|uniref:Uncharacterized protein n=1 Tax=Takifugu flavidus TaxID=433684 RepID=A0A5C6N0G0_9TELE|nr:hypothetical protein D4764_05G0008560 [Takifugu flavidus]